MFRTQEVAIKPNQFSSSASWLDLQSIFVSADEILVLRSTNL